MIRRDILFMAALLPLGGATGCLFTADINREPRADILLTTTGPIYRGGEVVLSGFGSDDPDGDELRASWSARACNADRTVCGESFRERTELSVSTPFTVTVPPTYRDDLPTQSVLVELTVHDPRQASDQRTLFVDVQNQAPTLMLQRQGFLSPAGSFPIGTSVRVVAAGTDLDGDEISYSFTYYPAQGSEPEAVGWEAVASDMYELRGDVTGLWEVEVTATDALGASDTETIAVVLAEDAPPCIGTTDPPAVAGRSYIVERDGPPRRFGVLAVVDDLDVYPPPPATTADGMPSPQDTARFRWFAATPYTGADPDGTQIMRPVSGHELSAYVLDPTAYAPGDVIELRVEIDDRGERELPCADDDPTCSLGGDGECVQRVTWGVEIR
ncbi:hypothetical protein [Haliangium sp.]|uniref:hypothetical protein n=1 Tax=Haliangium sp. TaxID=2663208 RepID=UPI003D0C7122